jgi:small-conductance mechanosensitive channel
MFEQLLQLIRDLLAEYLSLDLGLEVLGKIARSLMIIGLLWFLRWLGLRFVYRRFRNDARLLYNWRKTVEYSTVVLTIFLVGRIWLAGLDALVTYLGLLSAGIAIALQDLIVSLAGWVFIIWRRPFVVGDRIQIDDMKGDVIDVRLFAFSLIEVGAYLQAEQSTGRIIHIPNGDVFRKPLINTHQGYPLIWNEIPVMVTFESDWEKAKKILVNIINEVAPDVRDTIKKYERRTDRFVITYNNVTPTVYTSVADSGVVLTMRYLVDPRQRRGSEQEIWEAVLRAYALHWDIDFAYPTQREFLHFEEGKKRPLDEDAPTVMVKRQQDSTGRYRTVRPDDKA